MSSATRGGLVVRSVSKTFGRKDHANTAVAEVSLRLAAGESLGVVGESGSGKTTLARMIVGLTKLSRGSIEINGEDRSRPARGKHARLARAKQVQMVFQDPYVSLDPRRTATEAVDDALRLHGVADKRVRGKRIAEVLASVGISAREGDTRPRSLSGGQRQRIAIAKALAVDPEFLVMDEAVSALDVSVQAQILEVVRQLQQDNIGIVFVTHDLAVVRQVCDDVIVMRKGCVVESGQTRDVLESPSHPYTQMLIDAAPRPGWRPWDAA